MPVKLPGVQYWSLPRGYSTGLVRPVRWIVIHATANTASARAEAKYAAIRSDDRSRWTSAHFYVDSREVIGSVPMDYRAWAAYSEANGHGWHIEMCGLSDKVPAAVIERTAGLVRRLAELDDVPVRHCTPAMVADRKRGITGHADITRGLHVGSHTDPGDHFDWDGFIRMIGASEEEGMLTAKEIAQAVWDELVNWRGTGQQGLAQQVRAGTGLWYVQADAYRAWQHAQAAEAKVDAIATQLGVDLTAVRQRLEQLADLDEAAVAQQILATLTPQAIAAAVPAELARQVADELAARLAD